MRDRGYVFELSPALVSIVVKLTVKGTFSLQEFMQQMQQAGFCQEAEASFHLLHEAGLFVAAENDVSGSASDTTSKLTWDQSGWVSPRLYHESVVYADFLQGDADGWKEQVSAMQDISKSGEGPPVVKTYPTALEGLRLSAPTEGLDANFFSVLEQRRTIRSFGEHRSVTIQLVSNVLHYAARARSVSLHPYFGPQIRRTSPSGGARHPIEIYPQLVNSAEGHTGSFYYNHVEHNLYKLGSVTREFLYEISQRQVSLESGYLAFIITARFERNLWKYRYPKSYMFTLFDAGHFVQTLVLTCEALGLSCFLTPALDVRRVQSHLGIEDVFSETPLYLIIAGFRGSEE